MFRDVIKSHSGVSHCSKISLFGTNLFILKKYGPWLHKWIQTYFFLPSLSCPYRLGSVVKRHEARGCVSQHSKMRSGWGAHWQWTRLCIDLVVHQTPLLQECMYPGGGGGIITLKK